MTLWRGAKVGEYLQHGKLVAVPADWVFVPSGDAGLTRRLKSAGPYYLVVHRRRNRIEALGLLTGARVDEIRMQLELERADPAYQQKLAAGKRSRERKQTLYVEDFEAAVLQFLQFHPRYQAMAQKLAALVTTHATPVGSGTVARTERIPLERRAEAAVIAWMRHQTTIYDNLAVARVKGERRRVRQHLAGDSRELLARYRHGDEIDLALCPLAVALANIN